MEKLTIKPWQVMQAHENGANIEMSLIGSDKWSNSVDILWNWYMRKYRIANLTADGMRLDELVEKWPDKITVEHNMGECAGGVWTTKDLISTLILRPDFISTIKVNQVKKLRPWTMEEFKKHRDEWFVTESEIKFKVSSYTNVTVAIPDTAIALTWGEFTKCTREDGSPCGVLE